MPYLALATVLVVGGLIVATLFAHRRAGLRVASVPAHGTPSPPRREAASTARPDAVAGDAPWALSALPECFRQEREARGTPAFVAARMPAAARLLAPGVVESTADCTVRVGAESVTVERGSERLIVPPRARIFATGDGYALVRETGKTAELRVYRRVSGDAP